MCLEKCSDTFCHSEQEISTIKKKIRWDNQMEIRAFELCLKEIIIFKHFLMESIGSRVKGNWKLKKGISRGRNSTSKVEEMVMLSTFIFTLSLGM